MPRWEKLFKALGIYNKDYHEQYRAHIKSERYKTYIDLVANDIQEGFRVSNKADIKALVFSTPTFSITKELK